MIKTPGVLITKFHTISLVPHDHFFVGWDEEEVYAFLTLVFAINQHLQDKFRINPPPRWIKVEIG